MDRQVPESAHLYVVAWDRQDPSVLLTMIKETTEAIESRMVVSERDEG